MCVEQALKLTTKGEILHEISSRMDLKAQMVGSLYPRIIQDEIDELRILYYELFGGQCRSRPL